MARMPIRISTINPDALVVIHRARWLKANNARKVIMDFSANIDTELFTWCKVVRSRDEAAELIRARRLPETIVTKLLDGAGSFPVLGD